MKLKYSIVSFFCTAIAAAALFIGSTAAHAHEHGDKAKVTSAGDKVKVTFEYRPSRRERQTLEEVTLAGEFNGWDAFATELVKGEDGVFRVTLELAPGTYQWKMLLEGNWVQNMETIVDRISPKPDRFIPDPYGGRNAQNDFGIQP